MAANDTWTALADFATNEVVTASKLNQQLRDNLNVLQLGLSGDGSGEAEGRHVHKTGTMAARPAAGNSGRIYFVTSGVQQGVGFIDNGTRWLPLGIQILDRDTSEQDVVSTVAETSIYSYSIPADLLGATGGVRLTLSGDFLDNTAGIDPVRLRAKLGATTVFDTSPNNIAVDSNRRKWTWEIWFLNGSTSTQRWGTRFGLGIPNAAVFLVYLVTHASGAHGGEGNAASSEDTTADRTLDITITLGENSANMSFRKYFALLELLPGLS